MAPGGGGPARTVTRSRLYSDAPMRRRLVLPVILALLAAAAAGCGQSAKDKYIGDYKPLNDQLLKVGQELGRGVAGADKKSDAALARQFSGIAKDLASVNAKIKDLDTPAELKDESATLAKRIDATVKNVEDISKAAKDGDGQGAAAATVRLSSNASKVNIAQNKLAKATGAKIGEP